jgi:hypothetical protein
MRKVIIVAALVVVLVSGPALAGFRTGNDLYSYCQEPLGEYNEALCIGYILGVFDALDNVRAGMSEGLFCSPTTVNAGQVRDVVKKWLKDNPQHRHYSGGEVVSFALSKVWPCKK